jgi:hypothetical protein
MRMWGVIAEVLCRKHLLGEHVEMHMFVGTINKGKSIDGYVRDGLLDTDRIEERHFLLAHEMFRRGMKHTSPLPAITVKLEARRSVDEKANLRELCRRCVDCRERIEHFFGPEAYSDIPKGGDGIDWTSDPNPLYSVRLSGMHLPGLYDSRVKAIIALEKARKAL